MKHHITLKQWDEITKEQKNILWDSGFKRDWKMNIIHMLEFLGDDLCTIDGETNVDVKYEYRVRLIMWQAGNDFRTQWYSKLCDALWETVKYKLTTKL